MMDLANSIGLCGVGLILTAYFLLQHGSLGVLSPSYSWLNLAGALMVIYSLYFHWNLASMVINVTWVGISIMGLHRGWHHKLKRGD